MEGSMIAKRWSPGGKAKSELDKELGFSGSYRVQREFERRQKIKSGKKKVKKVYKYGERRLANT